MSTHTTRIVAVGDVHARGKRIGDWSGAWREAVEFADEHDAYLLQAGDLFDTCNATSREASTGTIRDAIAAPLLEHIVPTFVIMGNHDKAGPGQRSALELIHGLPGVHTYERGAWTNVGHVRLMLLPWADKAWIAANVASSEVEETFRQALRKQLTEWGSEGAGYRFNILLGHCEVTGADMGHNVSCIGGTFEISEEELALAGADLYLLGHFHKRQELRSLPGGYLGALTQQNYGEEGNPMGFRYLEITGDRITRDEWHGVDAPQYLTYEVDGETVASHALEEAQYAYVKARIEGDGVPANALAALSMHCDIVERVPAERTAQLRSEAAADVDLHDPHALLNLWCEANPGINGQQRAALEAELVEVVS